MSDIRNHGGARLIRLVGYCKHASSQSFPCRIRVTDVKLLSKTDERNNSTSDCKEDISQDENRQNGRAQHGNRPTTAFSRPQGARKNRFAQWIRPGKFVLLKRLAANIASCCTRFTFAVDKGFAMNASFPFVREDVGCRRRQPRPSKG